MAAQTLHQFISTFKFCIPSEQITSSHLHHFPLLAAQLLQHFAPSEQITTPQPQHNFIPLGSSILSHCTDYEQIIPSHLHLYTPFAAQTLHQLIQFLLNCIPFEQITPSPLHHFPLSVAQLLHHLPLWKKTPGSSTFNSLCPLWTNYHLALTPFFHLWQLNSYFNLPPLNKLPPPTSTPLYPLRQLNSFSLYPLWTNYTLTLTPLYPPL